MSRVQISRQRGNLNLSNNISFENSLDQGFKKLSHNDFAPFVAQLWYIKVSAMCQA